MVVSFFFADDLIGQLHDGFGSLRIQGGSVFVQDQEFYGGHGGHKKGHSLALAAGENAYLDLHLIFKSQSQGFQGFPVIIDALPVCAGKEVKGFSFIICQGHVFQYGHMGAGAHGRILVYPADGAEPFMFRKFCDIFSVHKDAAFIQRDASADQIQHGSFSRAVAPYYGDKLMIVYGQVKILKEAHLVYRACIIIFLNVF